MVKIAIIATVGVALIAIGSDRDRADKRANQPFLIPPRDLQHFTFGYRETIADAMWIRLIQDFDYCEQAKTRVTPDASAAVPAGCKRGWVFQMLDAVTELAPKFRTAYVSGGIMLSTIVHDIEGASEIFEKGVERFPREWKLLYYAAYHFMANKRDTEKAASLLVRAAQYGAPAWTYGLAARLYTDAGKAFLAKSVIENVLSETVDQRWEPRLRLRLEEANAALKRAPREQ